MNCLITGANRGLGLAFVKWATDRGYHVFASSRNGMPKLSEERQSKITWVQADLSDPKSSVELIKDTINNTPLDFIVHNAGLVDPDFDDVEVEHAQDVLAINITSPVFLTKSLMPNIRSGRKKKVIFIGSVSGVDNNYCPAVFYAASRTGIRGVTQQLRTLFKEDGISFPLIEPGRMATDCDYDNPESQAIQKHDGDKMPVHDLTKTIEWLLSLSHIACPKEIVLTDMKFNII